MEIFPVDPPFVVHLDAVEGCDLACNFCGINSIRDNGVTGPDSPHGKNSAPYRFADVATVEHVARQAAELGWNPRWEFALHGEPTMHKNLPGLIAAVRKHHPKGYTVITSNGAGLIKDAAPKVRALFDAGLNTLALDDYKHAGGRVDKIVAQLSDTYLQTNRISMWQYPAQPEGNIHRRHHGRMISVVHDISDNSTGNHQLTNQGGSAFATGMTAVPQRCAKPFREFNVRWNGAVALCCEDWKGQHKIGNVNDTPLNDLWWHPRFEAARRRLYTGNRDFGLAAPCTNCDVKSKRIGLLPDKLGKSAMLPEDDESKKHIRAALAGKVFSIKLAKGD